MKNSELAGKALTVLGPVPPGELGAVLPHEHLIFDISVTFQALAAPPDRLGPVSPANRNWVAFHPINNRDNLTQTDEATAAGEALEFRRAGGGTIVDVSSIGLGRGPVALKNIARKTGVHVIMGSGYYIGPTHGDAVLQKTEEEIADRIARDVTEGAADTGVPAGLIGEIGCSWPLQDSERKVLRAAARAQRRTGAPLNVHPGRSPRAPFEIAEILGGAGADLSRTVFSHIDRTLREPGERARLAQTGCFLEYDLFGMEGYYPRGLGPMVYITNDAGRVDELMELIERGYLGQLLISHDLCYKVRWQTWGGHGFSHILDNAVPLMREKGMPPDHIRALLYENPQRMLAFRPV